MICTVKRPKGGGTETASFVYGQGLLARDINNTLTYYLVGDNDNVIAIADESGNITDRYDYATFGELLSHTGTDSNRILFSTEPNDEDSGLVYLRARYYDPKTGIFLSKDPLYAFGANVYNYCDNNPVGWVDVSGLAARNAGMKYEYWLGKNKKELMWERDSSVCTDVPNFIFPNLYDEILSKYKNDEAFRKKVNTHFEQSELDRLKWSGKYSFRVGAIKEFMEPINESDLRPGDIVIYMRKNTCEHIGVVAIYDPKTKEPCVLHYSGSYDKIVCQTLSVVKSYNSYKFIYGRIPGWTKEDP